MRNRFTERDTEAFYDAEDALYRSFWDSEGSLHWGWFDRETGDDFLKACANLNRNMAEKAKIQASSQVLDLGCGNGTTATWLAKTIGRGPFSAIDSLASSARVSLQVHPLELFPLFVGDPGEHFPVLTIVGGHPG